ncbi:hypothetical protein SUGI_0364170 [Cryptomeria japonica]|nr:hypothetical protein SUGI_0364170 [Cryptomeria japonica]
MNDAIFKQASKLTIDPYENTLMPRWSEIYADSTAGCNSGSKSSPEKPIWNLKENLLREEVSLGVQCKRGNGS